MIKIKSKEFKETLTECMNDGCLSTQSYRIAESILQSLEKVEDNEDIIICPDAPNNGVELKFKKLESNTEQVIANKIKENHNTDECNCDECNSQFLDEFFSARKKHKLKDEQEEIDDSVKEMAITMIHKDETERYIGKLPIVFLATEDRTFGAGIAKFYADKYPKMRERNCGNHTDYLSVFRAQDLVKQDEYPLDDLSSQNGNIMFCVLTPKANRYAKMSDDLFETSLRDLFELLKDNGIEEIAMPKIGSRRENMDWSHTEYLIEKIGREYGFEVFWIIQDVN